MMDDLWLSEVGAELSTFSMRRSDTSGLEVAGEESREVEKNLKPGNTR
jgi:hypothetical protein